MGFSGGGSNVLKPHTHDGTIAQDGGALDMDGVTQGSLTAGDLVFSDGSNLQRLAIGGSGQALTSSGTAPQWSTAAAAGQVQLVDHTELGSAATEIDTSFASISGNDIACLLVYVYGSPTASADFRMQFNGITGNYYSEGQEISSGTQTFINADAVGYTRVGKSQGVNQTQMCIITVFTGDSNLPSASQHIKFAVTGNANAGVSWWDNGEIATNGVTTLDQVRLYVASGNLNAGTSMSIYRVNNT